ncbi:BH0573 unknown [Janthinobacterium sp. CG23_2]|nr:BH0573 unknown [Janthinobacterium sp. CG23_2]CUU31748.1 BH0573 unknown [Janthinobacterium sp. CG23_2]
MVAWNEQGEKVYEYAPVWPVDRIIDCYALNVASADDVWCCYYTNFPLVHLHKKRIASTWNVPVSGSNAFAIAGAHVLFAGGYDKRDSFTLVRLDPDGTSMLIDEFELIGDDGVAVKPLKTIGRDAVLYVLDDAVLYEIDLKHVLATRGRG